MINQEKHPHLMTCKEILTFHETQQLGLTQDEANSRLQNNGPNILPEGKKVSFVQTLLVQLKNIMLIVLLVAAVISFVMGEVPDGVIILLVVVLNVVLGAVQESRASAALDALKEMTAPNAMVIRDGSAAKIDARDLVVGDIVLLEAGSSIPADLRIIESASLFALEAPLTGESLPVEKTIAALNDPKLATGDMTNLAFMGCSISAGRGSGVVIATGKDTQMGKIADRLANTEDEITPLQKNLNNISKTLSIAVIIIAVVIFAIGLATGRELFDMFLLAISLAVAAIPEGLATVVTIMLAMGMKRMAQKGAIVRKLTAVESLGSTQVICSDKTGTLTKNQMTIEKVYYDNAFFDAGNSNAKLNECMAYCNDANIGNNNSIIGDPTETALIDYLLKYQLFDKDALRSRCRKGEIPFDSNRKMMSVIVNCNDLICYTKGAPDILIDRCSDILIDDQVLPLTKDLKKKAIQANHDMAYEALRVLAFAYKKVETSDTSDIDAVENNLIFIGLCGQMDPPRDEARPAVLSCLRAGIKPVMITGDHIETAKAIASRIGILDDTRRAITGREIEDITDEALQKMVPEIAVFARVSPEHKVRIVDAWQKNGMVVAMTGDGVNDAPALKSADIGVGMGITGTDVSKGASDIVLTDDNFATIIVSVEQGRNIYTNISKAIKFLLSSNFGEVIAIFIATLLGWRLFLPVHILWINLVTDTFPALALGMEPGEPDIMNRPPRDSKKPFFTKKLTLQLMMHGTFEGLIALGVYIVGIKIFESPAAATTMAFITLGLTQLFHALGERFENKSFFSSPFSNKYMLLAFFGSALLQVMVVIIPPIASAFSLVALTSIQWTIALTAPILMLLYSEFEKLIRFIARKK
ncbi:MAG: calcium-translocating P-type ATPase, PMCA-type [Clostridiales bacterium]|nr:calcium-translocating P-type ATPase, PMCA-type [Clostridiales bacterium]